MASLKADRLQIRVDPSEKLLLERAAGAVHLSVSSFLLQAACSRAAEVLADRRLIQLELAAAASFEEALTQPARVNERLATALKTPSGFQWI